MTSETPLLDTISSPQELKGVSREQLPQLAQEIRQEIIRVTSRGGLHLASSLGAVDLITALHYVLDSPKDRILFDVGHQAYAHKILTGRRHLMSTIKQEGGLSGFTKITESPHDAITVGHASTSLANALGMAIARDLRQEEFHVVPVIGDGSLTGGMALAALNTIGDLAPKMLIILNDNEMSISENVGAINQFMRGLQVQKWFQDGEDVGKKTIESLSKPLAELMSRAKASTRHFFDPASMNPFAAMGVRYVGPIDGHNIIELVWLLEKIVHLDGPTLLHVVTKKGKGLRFAEADPIYWHGPGRFDPSTGEHTRSQNYSWSAAFGDAVIDLAHRDPATFVITPAMREGSGLVEYSKIHPKRYLDVGISEEVAVTTAAGMALQGLKPIVAIYSSFLQRAYDQVLHDVAIENLNVTFAIDRAGIVGLDGATHNGVFDLSFLRSIPNINIGLPKDANELRAMLDWAQTHQGPFAIRYPRGEVSHAENHYPALTRWGDWEIIQQGNTRITLLAGGKALEYAQKAVSDLDVTLINARFVKPLDEAMLQELVAKDAVLITIEDNTIIGGFGSAVTEAVQQLCVLQNKSVVPVHLMGIPDVFQEHASIERVHEQVGIDAAAIRTKTQQLIQSIAH